jgi:hypothetical protein
MGRSGELNVGQLVRERFGEEACLIGFTTYAGTVTAAHDWDEPAERRNVRPGLLSCRSSFLSGVPWWGGDIASRLNLSDFSTVWRSPQRAN